MHFREKDKKTYQYFEEKGQVVQILRDTIKGRSVRYLLTDHSQADYLIIFVHGAPGSSKDFRHFMADPEVNSRARLISLDRWGYGFSNYGKSEKQLSEQANLIHSLVEKHFAPKVVLVGHSYGGPIIARYAMDYPDIAKGIFMLAPAIDPGHEKIFWFAHIARWKLTRWMLTGALKVSGDEKFSHVEELALMKPYWNSLKIPVYHMHAENDGLVPFENLQFADSLIREEYFKAIVTDKGNHFILWNQYDTVKKELFELMERLGE